MLRVTRDRKQRKGTMTHVTGGGLSPLHQQHSLSHLFIILELSAFMGGGEDRLQSPGDQG